MLSRMAAVSIAAMLAGCSSYSLLDSDATASFNQSGRPAWAKPPETPPPAETPQSIEGLMNQAELSERPPAALSERNPAPVETSVRSRSPEVASRPGAAAGLYAAVRPVETKPLETRAVEAKPIEVTRPEVVRPEVQRPPEPVRALEPPPRPAERPRSEARGHAYLFRGVGGLIYSRGMDRLAERINRTGVQASVSTYLVWRVAAAEAIQKWRKDRAPITVLGHSAGGDSAVAFAYALQSANVPVALLVTYDPTRIAADVPPNVERFINIYQSRNIMGGGDVTPAQGFHGHYASINLKDHGEIVHINIEKSERIHEQLVRKIAALPTTPTAQGEVVPIRFVVPARAAIDLWDSGAPVNAVAGDTVQSLAAAYRVPAWAVAQINKMPESAQLKPGQRIIVPRSLAPAEPAEVPVSGLGPQGR